MKNLKLVLIGCLLLVFNISTRSQNCWQKVSSVADSYLRIVKVKNGKYLCSAANPYSNSTVKPIYQSADLISWSPTSDYFPSAPSLAFGKDNFGKLFFGTSYDGVYGSDDDGLSWNYANVGSGFGCGSLDFAVDTLNNLYVSIGGYLRGLHVSADGGQSWSNMISGLDFTDIEVINGINQVYAVNNSNQVWFSKDNGSSWQQIIDQPFSNSTIMIKHVDSDVFIFTNNGDVYHSVDAGISWSLDSHIPITGSATAYLNDAIFISPSTWWVGISQNGVWRSIDNGLSWTREDYCLSGDFHYFFRDGSNLLATTSSGIYKLNSESSSSIITLNKIFMRDYNFPEGNSNFFQDILQVNGNLFVAGSSWNGMADERFCKFDLDGNLLVDRFRAASWDHDGFASVEINDAGNLICYGQQNNGGTYFDASWVFYNQAGDEIGWSNLAIGGSNTGTDLAKLANGNFIAAGPGVNGGDFLALMDNNMGLIRLITLPHPADWDYVKAFHDPNGFIYSIHSNYANGNSYIYKHTDDLQTLIWAKTITGVNLRDLILFSDQLFISGRMASGINDSYSAKLSLSDGSVLGDSSDAERGTILRMIILNEKLYNIYVPTDAGSNPLRTELALNNLSETSTVFSQLLFDGEAVGLTSFTLSGNYMYLTGQRNAWTNGTIPVLAKYFLNFSKLSQTIAFDLPPIMYQDQSPYELTAISTSNEPVTFSMVRGNATITGNQLTINGPGELIISAYQPGNEFYNSVQKVDSTLVDESYQVLGLITRPTNIPVTNGLAKLFYESGGLAKNGLVKNGNYSITLIRPGRYYLQVVPTGNEDVSAFPAYFPGVLFHQDATLIDVRRDTLINMELPDKQVNQPKGHGQIKGKIIAGNNGGGRFVVGRIAEVGIGLSNVPIYLLDNSNNVFLTSITDREGLFQFDELSEGTYNLALDVVGASLENSTTTISVNPLIGPTEVNATIAELNGQPSVVFNVEMVTGLDKNETEIRAYPNPSEGDFRIYYVNSRSSVIQATLIDLHGRPLRTINYEVSSTGEYIFPVTDLNLTAGLYVLQLRQGELVGTIKVLRKSKSIN